MEGKRGEEKAETLAPPLLSGLGLAVRLEGCGVSKRLVSLESLIETKCNSNDNQVIKCSHFMSTQHEIVAVEKSKHFVIFVKSVIVYTTV